MRESKREEKLKSFCYAVYNLVVCILMGNQKEMLQKMLEKNKEWKPFAYKRGCERKRTEEIEKMIGGEVMRLLN
jgi:hypothetical protein